eukprot:m.345813 g.345813  ORF g.345813 m.345813 type:complete len:463 (-) comp27391_c0_seq1:34-1422(-)
MWEVLLILVLFCTISNANLDEECSGPDLQEPMGWGKRSLASIELTASVNCNIPRVKDISDLKLSADKSTWKEAYIIKDGARSWKAYTTWTRAKFLDLYGNKPIRLRDVSSTVQGQFGHSELQSPIPRHLQPNREHDIRNVSWLLDCMGNSACEHKMHFDVEGSEVIKDMLDMFPQTPSFATRLKPTPSWGPVLSLGPPGAGLSFHNHGDAWLAQIRGSKLWLLYDPEKWPAENKTIALGKYPQVISKVIASTESDVRLCVVEEGDVIVVPRGWHHATFNLQETVAVGMQANFRPPIMASKISEAKLQQKLPKPAHIKDALSAAFFGNFQYSRNKDEQAVSYLTRAMEIEPNNFKMKTNLMAALLGGKKTQDAVNLALQTWNELTQLDNKDVCYVMSYIALLFFEASSTRDKEKETDLSFMELNLAHDIFKQASEHDKLDPVVQQCYDEAKRIITLATAHTKQ